MKTTVTMKTKDELSNYKKLRIKLLKEDRTFIEWVNTKIKEEVG